MSQETRSSVRAGRNMVLTPWAEATRDRARRAVHDAEGGITALN